MVVTALPDLAGAIVAYLRASAPVSALAGTKISARRQAAWNLPSYAVLVSNGRGGGGELDYGPIQDERVDVVSYGPDDRTAHLLWRTVHAALIPLDPSVAVGFTVGPTRVLAIYQEGGPIRLTDPDTAWEYTVCSYRFRYLGVPVT